MGKKSYETLGPRPAKKNAPNVRGALADVAARELRYRRVKQQSAWDVRDPRFGATSPALRIETRPGQNEDLERMGPLLQEWRMADCGMYNTLFKDIGIQTEPMDLWRHVGDDGVARLLANPVERESLIRQFNVANTSTAAQLEEFGATASMAYTIPDGAVDTASADANANATWGNLSSLFCGTGPGGVHIYRCCAAAANTGELVAPPTYEPDDGPPTLQPMRTPMLHTNGSMTAMSLPPLTALPTDPFAARLMKSGGGGGGTRVLQMDGCSSTCTSRRVTPMIIPEIMSHGPLGGVGQAQGPGAVGGRGAGDGGGDGGGGGAVPVVVGHDVASMTDVVTPRSPGDGDGTPASLAALRSPSDASGAAVAADPTATPLRRSTGSGRSTPSAAAAAGPQKQSADGGSSGATPRTPRRVPSRNSIKGGGGSGSGRLPARPREHPHPAPTCHRCGAGVGGPPGARVNPTLPMGTVLPSPGTFESALAEGGGSLLAGTSFGLPALGATLAHPAGPSVGDVSEDLRAGVFPFAPARPPGARAYASRNKTAALVDAVKAKTQQLVQLKKMLVAVEGFLAPMAAQVSPGIPHEVLAGSPSYADATVTVPLTDFVALQKTLGAARAELAALGVEWRGAQAQAQAPRPTTSQHGGGGGVPRAPHHTHTGNTDTAGRVGGALNSRGGGGGGLSRKGSSVSVGVGVGLPPAGPAALTGGGGPRAAANTSSRAGSTTVLHGTSSPGTGGGNGLAPTPPGPGGSVGGNAGGSPRKSVSGGKAGGGGGSRPVSNQSTARGAPKHT